MFANILPTDFGLHRTAHAATKSIVAVKSLLSGRLRNSGHLAKVREAVAVTPVKRVLATAGGASSYSRHPGRRPLSSTERIPFGNGR